jgi:hypothetical protein
MRVINGLLGGWKLFLKKDRIYFYIRKTFSIFAESKNKKQVCLIFSEKQKPEVKF